MHPKPYSESCLQNQAPILNELKIILRDNKCVLEIGSGTGQHAAYFPQYLPHLQWQASDVEAHLEGIEAWRKEANLSNQLHAIPLDVNQSVWPEVSIDAIFSANAIHIMSWPSVINMINGAAKLLKNSQHPCRFLCLYGPFNYNGNYSSESNARFDQWLKNRDPASGIRHYEKICQLAEDNAMTLQNDIEMPANNRILVFKTRV